MLLNNRIVLNIASAGRPAACWFDGTLWIGYRTPAGQATAARVDFNVNPITRAVTATTLTRPLDVTSSDDVAMCVYGGRLQVAGIGPDRQAWVTKSSDGVTFAAAVGTGIFCDAPVSLAAIGPDLFMAWMESTGELHLARSGNGVTFTDDVTSARTRTPPTLVSDDDMKYGWPGTITQTAQNAFFDDAAQLAHQQRARRVVPRMVPGSQVEAGGARGHRQVVRRAAPRAVGGQGARAARPP